MGEAEKEFPLCMVPSIQKYALGDDLAAVEVDTTAVS